MAGAGKPITIKIVGDEKDLEKSLQNAQKRLDGLKDKLAESGGQAEKTGLMHKRLGDFSGDAGNKIQDLAGKFTDHLGPAGNKVQGMVGGLTEKMGGMPVAAGAAAAGVGALGMALFKIGQTGVEKFTEMADEARKLQEVAGLSAENASALADAAGDLGVGADVAAAAMQKLSLNAAKNEEALAAHGVAVARTNDGSVDMMGTLYNVADAFQATTDPAARAELGTVAFGKSWATMIPLLAQGSQGLREMYEGSKSGGVILSQKDIDAARELQLNIKELKDSLDGMWVTVGRAVVPELAKMAKGAAEVGAKISELASHVGGIGNVMRVGLGMATGGMSELLRHLGTSGDKQEDFATKLDKAKKAMEEQAKAAEEDARVQDILTGGVDRAKAAFAEYTQRVKDATQADNDRRAALEGLGPAEIAHAKAVNQTAKDLQELSANYDGAQQAALTYGEGSKQAQEANAKFSDQLLTTQSSLLTQVGAQLELNQKTAEAAGHTYDAAQRSADYKAALEGLAAQMEPGNPLRVFLQGLIDKLNEVPSSKTVDINIEANYHGPISPTGEYPTAVFRAGGGRLEKGQPAIVGEEGRELFIPDSAGTVVPTARTNAMVTHGQPVLMGGGGGERPVVNNFMINITGVLSEKIPREVAVQIHEAMRQVERSIR